MVKPAIRILLALCVILAPFFTTSASAHHSRTAFFDQSRIVEVEGTITKVLWRHPHVRFWVQADEAYGGELWELESTPPSILEREGISRDLWAVGERVKVGGAPARKVDNAMEVSHVLLPDGQEVHLYAGLDTLWTDNVLERELQDFSKEAIAQAKATANGIFRVWSREGGIRNRPKLYTGDYPLTETAISAAQAYQAEDHLFTGCVAKVMPGIMDNIWPFEFVDERNRIRLRIEEFDQERVIYMGPFPEPGPRSTMGYSTGRWIGDSLVVTTTNLLPGEFGADGIQLSEGAVLTEYFNLSEDESRLDYYLSVVDPQTFFAPVNMESYWIWRPGEELKPYDCVEDPQSWTSSYSGE